MEAPEFSTARVWDEIVQYATQQEVDLVLLAGDLVDRENRFFESLGPLERGLEALHQAEIPVCAVAGNHDWDVLSRVANLRKGTHFYFLGQQGQWEQKILTSRNGQPVRILGWSFPAEHVRQCPLDGLGGLVQKEKIDYSEPPTIGLLHADLTTSSSMYAPVERHQLQAVPVVLWVVGHLHASDRVLSGSGAQILVPGSPQGLDPTETGAHGPWLIELDGALGQNPPKLTHVPLAPLWYENVSVDVSDRFSEPGKGNGSSSDPKEEIISRIREALRNRFSPWLERGVSPRRVLVRLALQGATSLYKEIDSWSSDLAHYEYQVNHISCKIEKLLNQTRPLLNLEELAQGGHLLGRLARLVLQLEQLGTPGELTPNQTETSVGTPAAQ